MLFTHNFDLSVVNFFNKFVIESENDVLVLHLKDGFGSFLLLYLHLRIVCEFGAIFCRK